MLAVKRLLSVALAMAAVLAGVAASEGVLRVAGYRYSPLKIGSNVSSDWREQHAFHDQYLVYDPVLIWRPLSSQFSPFNPQGFRGAPIDAANTSGHRIIALGDSNTFGWTVDDGANWPAQLQGLYDAAGPGTEVVNAGVWGYTSFQGLRRFNEIVRFSPDVVLVSFGGNERNLSFVVPSAVAPEAMRQLHAEFFEVAPARAGSVAEVGR